MVELVSFIFHGLNIEKVISNKDLSISKDHDSPTSTLLKLLLCDKILGISNAISFKKFTALCMIKSLALQVT